MISNNDKSILDKYEKEVKYVRFFMNASEQGYVLFDNELDDYLNYIKKENNSIYHLFLDSNIVINFEEIDDIKSSVYDYYTTLYGGKVSNRIYNYLGITNFECKNEYNGGTIRKFNGENKAIESIHVTGKKDCYSASILVHELAHALYNFTSNISYNETIPILHEWLYADSNYHLFRSFDIFAHTEMSKIDYEEIEDRNLANIFKVGNEFVIEMYTLSYITSLILKDCYDKDPKHFLKKLLEYKNNPNVIKELLYYYNMEISKGSSVDIVENNYKVLTKKINGK